MGERWTQRWRVPSASRPGLVYIVARDRNDVWGCTCPRYKFHREICKHIQDVQNNQAEFQEEMTSEFVP